MYKKTGFHFDVRLEKDTNKIKYLSKNENLSFKSDIDSPNKNIKNQLIIGDNYDALKNLLINYRNQIDVIYIDPPYGKDDMGQFAETNYNNAITRDNLLSMLYPRLQMAKQLLSEDGVIFCSIDDKNQAYVKCLFDDIFGENNFLMDAIRKTKSTTNDAKEGINIQHESLLIYSKKRENVSLLHGEKDFTNYKNPDNDPLGTWIIADPSAKSGTKENNYFSITNPYTGTVDYPPEGRFWCFSKNTVQSHIDSGRICFKKEVNEGERGFIYKRYKNDLRTTKRTFDSLGFVDNLYLNQVGTKELKNLNLVDFFKYPKSVNFIKEIIDSCSHKNAKILDFFAGSGTTGQAVLELNRDDNGQRSFILCTNNEKTEMNPNGIAYDVTSKRLKRVMTGECYDGSNDFKWIQDNEALGGDLEVVDISECDDVVDFNEMSPFELIDETLYGLDKFENIADKIKWVCENFKFTMKSLDEEHSSNSKENE